MRSLTSPRQRLWVLLAVPALLGLLHFLSSSPEAGLRDECAPDALIVRFAPGAVSFPDHLDYGHNHFTAAIEQATFFSDELKLGLIVAGVESFETIGANWRNLTDRDLYDRHGNRVQLVDFTHTYRVTLDGQDDPLDAMATIAELPGVRHVGCDRFVRVYFTPDDSLYPQQWHLHSDSQVVDSDTCDSFYDINAPEAWDIWDSAGTKIGIFDDGARCTHEDLAGYIDTLLSKNFTDDPDGWCDQGHGTGVAGLAAAGTDNDSVGVAGVADLDPNHGDSTLVILRILAWQIGDSTISDAVQALDYICGENLYPRILVANHSWGHGYWRDCYDYPPTLRDAFRNAFSKDINLVCSAGQNPACDPNSMCSESDTCFSYPADFLDYSLAVAAVTCHGDTIPAPQFKGSYIDLTAPGGGGMYRPVNSGDDAYGSGGYGTSFAAPLVSGTIALLLGAEPDLTNEDCYKLLELTASDMEGSPMSAGIRGGHGLVRADTALVHVTGSWELKHGSVMTYSSIYLGKGWREWMNVTGFNQQEETWDSVWVRAYRLKSTVDLTSAAYDSVGHVWPRGRTSSGWKNVDVYDARFHANHAELLGWNAQTEVATFGTYTFLAFADSTEADTLCWFPFRPSTAQDDCDAVGGLFKIDYSYLVYSSGKGLGASPQEGRQGILRFAPAATVARAQTVPFHFTLTQDGSYSLAIFDVTGRAVRWLLTEIRVEAGKHTIEWDRRDAKGRLAGVGVYFAKLWRTDRGKEVEASTARLVLVR